jgi:hypothetical protein
MKLLLGFTFGTVAFLMWSWLEDTWLAITGTPHVCDAGAAPLDRSEARICINVECGWIGSEDECLDYKHPIGARMCPKCHDNTERFDDLAKPNGTCPHGVRDADNCLMCAIEEPDDPTPLTKAIMRNEWINGVELWLEVQKGKK